ncbi:unnamed protein product [Ceutorhynchus assimilis]|uniref:Very long-chain fatty acid transport protein n=1 Tax=Ceutorhynchus assimilis TaxID=467358 RepID=A0A9N9QSW1_9CUCU|nr:unnamed protein product [Ceutorhynchus assimilis]
MENSSLVAVSLLDNFSNRLANYFKSIGYKKGDSVALLLENRPEYLGIWLGLSKIGVIAALINTNLVSDSLVHSIFASKNKGLIFGSSFSEIIRQISEEIRTINLYEFKDDDNIQKLYNARAIDLKQKLQESLCIVPPELSETETQDSLLYIYTSGTTGLPKAAIIRHSRYMLASGALFYLTGLNRETDILYNALPLYHSAGGMLAAGVSLLFGTPVVLKRKFSASNFWMDCEKYNCTVAIYIGEICRYLLAAHKPDMKLNHKVKKVCGNGLKPQIWQQFKNTFGIEEIYEFYGATEGNAQMVNIDGRVGAVGFVPVLGRWIMGPIIIQCDENTGEPIRTKGGLCKRCKVGEPGLLVGKINQKQLIKAFVGYADSQATKTKILQNILVEGDAYFNTGDILVEDELGYLYFRDRTGDTFRWKGENVATCEVEAIISNFTGYNDAIVYGVEVPGSDGKAGMAAIVDPEDKLNIKELAQGLKSKLPSYAVPVFVRVVKSVPLTGTFKLKKVGLQKEGFNVHKIEDGSLYVLYAKNSEYQPLTSNIYSDIVNGEMRL